MAISMPNDGDDDQVMAAINTTPLVDVMLVLLIIFLITIPVAIQTVPVELPKANNQVTIVEPGTIVVAVDSDGDVFWNAQPLANTEALVAKLKEVAVQVPQPQIQVRGDKQTRFESIGRVIVATQRSGIRSVSFVTEPDKAG